METLIHGLIERTSALLPFNKKPGATTKIGDLRMNAQALIKLSKTKLDAVIEGLLHLYSTLSKSYNNLRSAPEYMTQKTQEERDVIHEKFIRSKIIIFQLLSKTLSSAIGNDKYDLKFDEDYFVNQDELYSRQDEDDEDEPLSATPEQADGTPSSASASPATPTNDGTASQQQQIQQSEPSVPDNALPPIFDESKIPTLETSLAQTLLKYILETLFPVPQATPTKGAQSAAQNKIPTALKQLASRVLYKVSVVNFEVVFGRIDQFFRNMKPDEVDPSVYNMIEYVNFDSWKLSKFISLLNDAQVQSKFKKNAFLAIANPLRQAIWNWITNYPHQFIKIARNRTSLPGNPMLLFENISASKADKKGGSMWPVQIMILLLCPEILAGVIMSVKQGAKNETYKKQRKFVENVLKALRNPKDKPLQDMAVVCLVDLYRASTFLNKNDLSALRFLVADVQNDLQERLFSADNPVKDSEGKTDLGLIVDFVVSAYRINQRHVSSYMFPLLLKGAPIMKLVLSKALLKLVSQGALMPWHPTIMASNATLAKPLRTLFQELLQEERKIDQQNKAALEELKKKQGNASRPQNASTGQLPTQNELSGSTETLLHMLAVFYYEPRLITENTNPPGTPALQHVNEMLYLFGGLCTCLQDFNNVQVQNQAYRLLQKLFQRRYMEIWCPQDIATAFVELSSAVLTQLAAQLIADKDLQGQNNKTLLELVKEITSSGNKFIARHYDKITPEHLKSRKRVQSLENAETALLVLLCSSEPEIWATAASCFDDLTQQIRMLRDKENKQGSLFVNYNLYVQLAKVDELGRGRSSQHKAIRKLLRKVDLQTKANLAAFIEVYSRWKAYTTTLLTNASSKDIKDDEKELQFSRMKQMWKNYTAFLCSMGGVCLAVGDGVFATSNVSTADKKKSIVGSNKDNAVTDDLIKDLMKHMVSDIQFVKDTITQTIGTELSPTLYGSLFTNLHSRVESFFTEEGGVMVSDASTQFVDQAIYVVKSIIEQGQENADDLALANFETLLQQFVKYCSQLVLNFDSVRIKCKLCILIETMMNHKENITFSNEIQFRFMALKNVIEWTSDFALKSSSPGVDQTPSAELSKQAGMFRDLDVLCMRAIAALLKDLPLTKLHRDRKGTASGKERNEAAKEEKALFMKYFTFLSKYLQRSKVDKDAHPQLREFTIIGLGNLLESNINYGLEHFMKMAYAEDQETRSAFLAVLTTIVKQGINLNKAEEESETIAQTTKKYDRLLEVVTGQNLDLVWTLLATVPLSSQDQLCKILVTLFEQQGQTIRLLKAAIDREVEQTSSFGTLFRANSSASKMITAYAKLLSKDYLQQTLGSLIKELTINPGQYEVDPLKKKPQEDLQQNIKSLEQTAKVFLDCILMSADDLPKNLRIVCKYLADCVHKKFPSSNSSDDEGHPPKYVAIGGMFFLRFMNPAIVTPHVNGITEQPPSPEATRCLMLITKLLMNLSNGVRYTVKEEFMTPFNGFVDANKNSIRAFFDSLVNVDPQDTAYNLAGDQSEERDDTLIAMHRLLFENHEKLLQKLQQDKCDASLTEQVQNVLSALGKPPAEEEESKRGDVQGTSGKEFMNSLFTEFVMRMEVDKQLADKVKKIEDRQLFYRKGESKEKRPVLYFAARMFGTVNPEEIDYVYYHVLVTLRSVFANPYDVVFDCTDLKDEHELKPALFAKLHKMLPQGARKNLARVIIYNPNSYLKSITKPFSKFITRRNMRKIEFATSLKEMKQFIEDDQLGLPESTTEFEKAIENTISPAYLVTSAAVLQECTIKISLRKIQIVVKKDNILGIDTKRIDFIDIAGISNVRIERNPQLNDNVVTVSYDYPVKNMSFKTDNNDQLLMAIRSSFTRHVSEYKLAVSLQQQESQDSEGQTLREQDIPGSCLNMCFLNLEAKFPKTRTAAYNLLAALAEQFDFPVTLLEASNVTIPHNTGDLVQTLSEQVAQAKPFLTSQFLRESLRGFTKISLPYKYLCLKYMKPWFKNLSNTYAEAEQNGNKEEIEKINEWFSELTKATIENENIYPAMLSEVWGEISKDRHLVSISINCIVKEAMEAGLTPQSSKKIDILQDLVVTLCGDAEAAELVSKALLDGVQRTFDEEIKDVTPPLEANAPWAKIIIYCRFLLMLSFQNRIQIMSNLPSLVHIITLMIGRGSTFVRATIHALTINVIHSLATELLLSSELRKSMQNHLHQLASETFLDIFMGNPACDTNPFQEMNASKDKNAKIRQVSMWDLEVLASFFCDVMKTCYKADPSLESKWHPQWVQLCKTDSEKLNPILLPRLLAVFGVIVSPREVQDQLPFVMQCLVTSFVNYTSYRVDLPVSVLLCLGQFASKLSADSPMFKRVVLIPIILLSASDPTLFVAVVHLLKCVLQALSSSHAFRDCKSLEEYFNLHVRNDADTEQLISKFEKITGISFRTHFSFALAAHLMKGLTLSSTKEATTQMYSTLINVTNTISTNIQDVMGYVTALVTYNMDSIPALLGGESSGFQLFAEENFVANAPTSANLFVRFLLTVVQNLELEFDKCVIYQTLQDSFQKLPSVFEPIYSQVMPRVVQVYNQQTTSSKIAEVTLSLINTMMSSSSASTNIGSDSMNISPDRDLLKDINFSGLTRVGSFKTNSEKTRQDSLAIFLDYARFLLSKQLGVDEKKLKNMLKLQDVNAGDDPSSPVSGPTSSSGRLIGPTKSMSNLLISPNSPLLSHGSKSSMTSDHDDTSDTDGTD